MSCLSPQEGAGGGVQGGTRLITRNTGSSALTPPSPLCLSQMLLSQLLPLEPESTPAEEDTKEGSSFGPQFLSSTLPFLPSGARAARPSLWRKTLASRKWALPGDWAWKAVPRGCFGLKLDRIGTFSGLGC
ncbi:C-type natriuretic peptide 1-like isoform X1 [Chroicocephalus ridibundus]|uniref:C-type natriuretic peptide 1-like isoform X1 n=1 Tax=Chroicocephalus ridibundus TaxID=1192867 RepID=UPI002FDC7DAF